MALPSSSSIGLRIGKPKRATLMTCLSARTGRTCANGESVKPIGNGQTGEVEPPAEDGERVIQLPEPPGRNVNRGLQHDIGTGFAPERYALSACAINRFLVRGRKSTVACDLQAVAVTIL